MYFKTLLKAPESDLPEFEGWVMGLRAKKVYTEDSLKVLLPGEALRGIFGESLEIVRAKLGVQVVGTTVQGQKRLLPKTNERIGGVYGFVYLETKKEKHTYLDKLWDLESSDLEKNVEVIGQNLFGSPNTPEAVLIRPVYKTFLKMVLDKFRQPSGNVLVAGSRGIGKSVFGLLAVLALAIGERKIVCYEHKQRRMIVVGKNVEEEPLEALKVCLSLHRYEESVDTSGAVYEVTKSDLGVWDDLISQAVLIHVQDLGDDSTLQVNPNGDGRKLVLSSPNHIQLSPLHSHLSGYLILYLPLWSKDEVITAHRLIFKNGSEGEVLNRFEKFGGIPRFVLQETPSEAESTLRAQLGNIEISVIKKVFRNTTSFINLESHEKIGALIHVVPSDDFLRFKCVPASKEIEILLAERLVKDSEFEVQKFISAVNGVPQLAQFCGFALEEYFHKFLTPGKITNEVQLGHLEEKKKDLQFVKKLLPSFTKTVKFGDASLAELRLIDDGDYVRPKSKINKTFDSFAIMDHAFFDASKKGKCIAIFQVTVSSSHEVKGPVLKNVQEKVKDVYPGAKNTLLPIVLVFASKTNGIQTPQTIQDFTGKAYTNKTFPNSVAQYVVRIPGYDEIAQFATVVEEEEA